MINSKQHQSLMEAAMSVQTGTQNEITKEELINNYLSGYFGDDLNEDTTEDQIMEAFADLLELADKLMDFIGEDDSMSTEATPAQKAAMAAKRAKRKKDLDRWHTTKDTSSKVTDYNKGQASVRSSN